jgi:lipopolysaccharide biosynthesis glycosyltransferase
MSTNTAGGVTLVTLADERYALPLAVLGRSLTENLCSGCRATLYIVDGGIAPETKRHLIASWDPERLRVEFVPPQFGQERELPVWGRLPPLTYVRVFVPLVVPRGCGKVIFLDSDVVIQTDIERLWNVEMGDHCVLAVQDPAVPFVSSRDGLRHYQALGIPRDQPYFNAGVMVVNVERWMQSNVSERVMEFIHRNAHELNYCDQDGLNAILWRDWDAVDSRWQVQPRLMARHGFPLPHLDDRKRTQLSNDAWIFHFSGRLKPWIYRGSSLPDRIFYEYLDRTWWSGWRPSPSMKALMYRLYDSRLRDCCYPVEQRGHAIMRRLSRRSVRV